MQHAKHIKQRQVEPWPQGRGTGGFSKVSSKVQPSIEQAILACKMPHYRGDLLIKYSVYGLAAGAAAGWQVWLRRATARGIVKQPGDYDIPGTPGMGRRAKKRISGCGRLFLLAR